VAAIIQLCRSADGVYPGGNNPGGLLKTNLYRSNGPALVEILLRNGRSLKVPVDVELKLLTSPVACLEAA
jgi:hypothetical protein